MLCMSLIAAMNKVEAGKGWYRAASAVKTV